jgi:uncharacterized protein (TIGR03437 family)
MRSFRAGSSEQLTLFGSGQNASIRLLKVRRTPAMLLWLVSATIVSHASADLPEFFEENRGQAPANVKFLLRSSVHNILLEDRAAALSGPAGSVSLRFVGSRPGATLTGILPQKGRVNYFIGRNPFHWRTDIPTFGGVRYRGLYKGIDLVFHASEYDFVVSPGSDPARIEMEVRGARRMRVLKSGELELELRNGTLLQPRPLAFQHGKRVEVSFVRRSARSFGFRVGDYDSSRPLLIDPVLLYSTYLGGSGNENRIVGLGSGSQLKTAGIAVDSQGNAYVTGYTDSIDFTTVNGFEPTSTGSVDAFVAKISPAGNTLVYATYIGGPGDLDRGFDIAVDEGGAAFVVGRTQALRFPLRNAFQRELRGTEDGFIVKLHPSGSSLEWSTYLGGSGNDDCHSVAVLNGDVYVAGETRSPDFPLQDSFNNAFLGGPTDVFVARFRPDGSGLVFSTFLSGNGLDDIEDLAVDAQDNVYIVGNTASMNLLPMPPPGGPPGLPQILQSSPGGAMDAYLIRLDARGQFQFGSYLGGSGVDAALGVAARSPADVYIVGATASQNFPTTTGAFQRQYAGALDAWFSRIDTTTPRLLVSTLLGGSGNETASAVAIDRSGRAWIAGLAETGFPLKDAVQSVFGGGSSDAFLARMDVAGTDLQFATFLGGSGADGAFSLALDPADNAYITGFTASPDFPVFASALQRVFRGGRDDAFIAMIGERAEPVLVSGATFASQPLAPESYATLMGTGLADLTAVLVTDRTGWDRPARIVASATTQVNFLLPAELTPGPAVVRFIRGSQEITRAMFDVALISPGIFTANANGMGAPAALVVRTTADGAQTVAPVFTCAESVGTCRPAPIDMPPPAIYDLILFGTGIRARTSVQGVQARSERADSLERNSRARKESIPDWIRSIYVCNPFYAASERLIFNSSWMVR